MIFGANGYAGELITRYAVKKGHRPIIAGRNKKAILALAKELDLPYRILDLSDNLSEQFTGLGLVLNCAGPFTKTVKPILDACLQAKCHYLDISGELDVFDYCLSTDEKAQKQGCIVCPGVAFDIVPTEAVAAKLKLLLPDADTVKLGFDSKMTLSKGSTITLLEGVGNPRLSLYMVRDKGELLKLSKPRIERFSFVADKPLIKAMAITWADINGAFYSTHIPNISVFIPATTFNRIMFAYMSLLQPVVAIKVIQKIFSKMIKIFVKGPAEKEINSGRVAIFGEAHNAKGERKRVYINVAHGYKFTYLAAVASVEFCLKQQGKSGYFTPSMLMGVNFVEGLEGSTHFKVV